MGFFIYQNVAEYELEDRALAHMKRAIAFKLLRQDSFFVNWTRSQEKGSGRVSIWVSPFIPIAFHFSGSRTPEINPAWIEALKQLVHTPAGLIMISEKAAEEYLQNYVPADKIRGKFV